MVSKAADNHMLKKYLALIIFFSLFLIFFYKHAIINTVLETYLISHAQKMGTPLSFEKTEHKNNALIFFKPTFQIDGGTIEANKLVIQYAIKPFERVLDLKIDLQEPNCNFESGQADLQKCLNNWFDGYSFFKIAGEIRSKGNLYLKNLLNQTAISFTLNQNWGKNREGSYSFAFEDSQEKGSLHLYFQSEAASHYKIKASAKQVDAKLLSQTLKTVFPHLMRWKIHDGILDGELDFSLSEAKLKTGNGKFNILNLEVEDTKYGIWTSIQEGIFLIDAKNQNALFKLLKNCSIIFKDEETYAEFKNFNGTISVENSEHIHVNLKGIWEDPFNSMETELKGEATFLDFSNLFIKVLLTPLKDPKSSSYITLKTQQMGELSSAEIVLKRFEEKQFHFWQRALENLFPGINPISYHGGSLNALIHFSFDKKGIQELSIKNIEANKAFVVVKPWEMALAVDKLYGDLSINLQGPTPRNSLNANLKIENGGLSLIGAHFDFWNFTNIETDLSIRNGVFQKSSASVELAGLKGSAEMDFLNENSIIQLHLEGNAIDLKPFLPKRVQPGIDKSLHKHKLSVSASIAKKINSLSVKGDLLVQNEKNENSLPLTFGFDLEKSLFEKESHEAEALAYLKIIAPAAEEKMVPPALKTLTRLETRWILQEFGIQGFVMRNGWFKAEAISLEKYLSPFLFVEDQMSLKGVSSVRGTFDQQGVSIQYDAKNITLENEHFIIEAKEISGKSIEVFPGSHYIDFTKGKHFGQLPLNKSSYFDKNHGLLFTDLKADILFEEKKVHLLNVETFSNGMLLAGHIDIDYSNPLKGSFDLNIYVETLHGKLSEAQHFFSHFNQPFLFLKLPMEAEINLKDNGGELFFAFRENDFDLISRFSGTLSDGYYEGNPLNLRVVDLNLDFEFDSVKNYLSLTDLQGALLVGEMSQAEEYSIAAEKIYFTDYQKNLANFDIWIGDKTRDLIRIVGKTVLNDPVQEKQNIQFLFDENLTHFGDIHPHDISLSLSDWEHVEEAKLNFNFRLSSLLYDLQKLSKCGLFCFSEKMLSQIESITHAGGELTVTLEYEALQDQFLFSISGHDMIVDKHQFKTLSLNGKQRGKIWSIDELKLDDISLSAELTKENDLWKSDFIGLRFGKSILIGLTGQYREGESILAHVKLLEIDLPLQKNWDIDFVKEHSIQGKIYGTGQFTLSPPKKGQKWHLDALLELGLKSCKIDDLNLADVSGINCHFVSGNGITLTNAALTFENWKGEAPAFYLHKANFDLTNYSWDLERTDFSIEADKLPLVSKYLRAFFPNLINDSCVSLITHLKKEGSVKGGFNFTNNFSNYALGLWLEDGIYEILEKPFELKSFQLDLANEELKIATQYLLNNHFFWISTRSDANRLDKGVVLLADEGGAEGSNPLLIHWRRDKERGFTIERASGNFAGMQFQLQENGENPTNRDSIHLRGEIFVLQENFRNLFSSEIASALGRWQVGKGYALQGDFEVEKDMGSNENDIRFFGTLTGENFELKGYRFKHLFSQVVFGPKFIQISDIKITDPAGALYIGEANILKKEGQNLELSIPLLTIQEMRPSLLVEIGKPPAKIRKPLIIKNLYVENLKGTLGNEDSFTGKGNLDFVNPVKKHLQNTIFAIPAEILTRIGLDSSVLTPVAGTIQYEIYAGKVHFTKFKDVHSHSKLSKFYLPHNHNSSVDFDGNLNIQVKMRQYTLLFKLAEMFTVTINGNLKKPTYTLQRQKPLHKAEIISSESMMN